MSAIGVPSQQGRAVVGIPFVGQPIASPLVMVNRNSSFFNNAPAPVRYLTRFQQITNDPYIQCFYSDNTQLYCQAPQGCCQTNCCAGTGQNLNPQGVQYQTAAYNDPHAENIGMGAVWVVVAMGIFVFLFALGLLGWYIARKVKSSSEKEHPTYVSYQGSSLSPADDPRYPGYPDTVRSGKQPIVVQTMQPYP